MSLVPSMCWSYNPQDFFLWPAIHSIVLKSSRREQQGRRRDWILLLQTSFIDLPLARLQALFPQQCPKQPNTCCRGSQTGLPLTGPSTRWLTFWVLEPRPGSPAGRLPWKGKLGEFFICGEFCWLLLLPPPLVPVLKLRARLKVFSEQEMGNPLQRSRYQLPCTWEEVS